MAATEPPEPDWVVGNLAARGEVTQLWGAPGVGKSLLVEAAEGWLPA
jgi:predicted ATP-dependent serine protease